jgi:hypothetical protein
LTDQIFTTDDPGLDCGHLDRPATGKLDLAIFRALANDQADLDPSLTNFRTFSLSSMRRILLHAAADN